MNTDVAVLENEVVENVVEAKVKKPRVRKPKNFVSPELETQEVAWSTEIEATEPVTLEEMFAAELSTGDATDKVNQLFADKPESEVEVEEVVEVEEKAPKAPKQRATKEKAPKVQKAPKQREKIVRVAPEGYMWFGDVARLLDVRYQQVFQRFSSGRLSGMLYEGHWCAAAGSVNEWIESRARYFARKGA